MINRESGDKAKGFRLQKMRATSLILKAIERNDNAHIYAAIESIGDVILNENKDSQNNNIYLEEDKNYKSDTKFTYNSHEILNTLVYFLDAWISFKQSDNIFFGFYSTNKIGKEGNTDFTKKNNIIFPDECILNLLIDKSKFDKIYNTLKSILINKYKQEYQKHSGDGNLTLIKNFDESEWKTFFERIDWKFEQEDEEQLNKQLIRQIQAHPLYNQNLEGREKAILARIIEEFDRRQRYSDPTKAFVYASDIKVIFLEEESNRSTKALDPTWQMWDQLDIDDFRSLKEKIKEVCQGFSSKKIEKLNRKAAQAMIERQDFELDKSCMSLRYRVYDCCLDELDKLENSDKLEEFDIDNILINLEESVKKLVLDVKEDFNYQYSSESIIKGIILELFDSCFLAFN